MAVIGTLDGQGTLSTGKRRRLQLFRNTTNLANADAAKQAIAGQELLDGEVIIARYNGDNNVQQGVLAIKGIGDNNYVYFDSAALADALQTVSGGTGISASTKENNNQVISLNISGETQEGKIVINDKTSGEKVVEITGLTAANVTYDKGTGDSADKVITGATTTSAAIKELDAALDAANKANLTGATVEASNDKATVTFKNSNNDELSKFTVESTDANLAVAATGATGITLDIKSVGADKTDGTGEKTGDTTGDVLTQKSYVDNEIAKAKKTAAVAMASSKSTATGATTVEFTKVGTETDAEKYYVNMTVGEGSDATVYNIELDAKNFVKDSFLAGADTGFYVEPENGTTQATKVTKETEGAAAYIELTMKTITDPDPATEGTSTLSYIYVKTSDILGDINGGKGISFDGSTVSIDLAENATGNTYVQLTLGTDADSQLGISVDTATVTKDTAEDSTTKGDWVSSDDATDAKAGLATAQNLKEVANDLQDQIDALESESLSGSTAISVAASTIEGETSVTRVKLVLDADTASEGNVTIGETTVKADRVVTGASNALCVTENGLYLSNIWDCGEF